MCRFRKISCHCIQVIDFKTVFFNDFHRNLIVLFYFLIIPFKILVHFLRQHARGGCEYHMGIGAKLFNSYAHSFHIISVNIYRGVRIFLKKPQTIP